MSWFVSIFSGFKFPPPADSIRPQPRRLLEEPVSQIESATPVTSAISEHERIQEEGRRRNKIITAAGFAFLGLSALVTKRSLSKRRLASKAAFYSDAPAHNVEQAAQTNGALEAVDALRIATINVLSVFMIATGASLWYFDINSLTDARTMIRGGLGVDGTGKTEEEANEEIEEVIASILARKDAKSDRK